jgi:hypothetical protein
MVYFATDGDGKMKPVKEMSKKGQKLTEINGETSTLSKFRVLFPEVKSKNVMDFYTYSTNVQSLTDIYPDSMRRLGGKYVEWNNNPKVPKYHFQEIPDEKKPAPVAHDKNSVIAFIVTAELPITFEVIFESISGDFERKNSLTGAFFDEEFQKHENNFGKTFQKNFNFGSKYRSVFIENREIM